LSSFSATIVQNSSNPRNDKEIRHSGLHPATQIPFGKRVGGAERRWQIAVTPVASGYFMRAPPVNIDFEPYCRAWPKVRPISDLDTRCAA
jgi:hypothetical protein